MHGPAPLRQTRSEWRRQLLGGPLSVLEPSGSAALLASALYHHFRLNRSHCKDRMAACSEQGPARKARGGAAGQALSQTAPGLCRSAHLGHPMVKPNFF